MDARPRVGGERVVGHFAEQGVREAVARLAPTTVEELAGLQLHQALVQRGVAAGFGQGRGQHRDVHLIASDRGHRQHALCGLRQGVNASQDEASHRAGQRGQ